MIHMILWARPHLPPPPENGHGAGRPRDSWGPHNYYVLLQDPFLFSLLGMGVS